MHAGLAVPIALGGAVVGYAGGKGWLSKLPSIGGSRMFTLGIAGWAAMKFSRNRYIKAAGLAAVGAAAFHFGLQQTDTKSIAGDDGLAGPDGDMDGDVSADTY